MITQAKISLQKSGLAGQLLKIKNQYECLVQLIEKMEIVLICWRVEVVQISEFLVLAALKSFFQPKFTSLYTGQKDTALIFLYLTSHGMF